MICTQKHIPVTLVTGFLGSGKTTLLNRFLAQTNDIRYALIINEFGEIGIDAGLIKSSQDFVKMDNGCLCCVLSDELIKTIGTLAARDDYDAVVLETTGIADPLPIAWPFLRPEFQDKFRFAGIVTVVDAAHFEKMLTQAEEPKLQVERADFIYLTKTDLCSPEQVASVMRSVNAINPNARLVQAGDADALKLLFDHNDMMTPKEEAHMHTPHHEDHASGYDSLSVNLNGKLISLTDMEDLFEALPKEVFRAKAIFKNKDDGHCYAIHAVCGRVDFYELEEFNGTCAAVFIGKGMEKEELQKKFAIIF